MAKKTKKETIKIQLTNGADFLCDYLPLGEDFTLSNDPMLFDFIELSKEDIVFFDKEDENKFRGCTKIYVL
jgi:hypothetical protein